MLCYVKAGFSWNTTLPNIFTTRTSDDDIAARLLNDQLFFN